MSLRTRQHAAPFVSQQHGARRRHVGSPGSQTDLRISFLPPGENDAQSPAIEMLLRIIDDGMSTRLYHRLCDASGLVTIQGLKITAEPTVLSVTK